MQRYRGFKFHQVTESLSKMEISPIYTSDKNGSDEKGEGSQDSPFKTPLQAMRHWGKVRILLVLRALLLVLEICLYRTHQMFSIHREILGRSMFCAIFARRRISV